MNRQDLLSHLQSLQMDEFIAKFQAVNDNATKSRADQAKKQSLESKNVELVQQLKNLNMAMRDVIAQRDVLKEQHAASQSREQELESQNAGLIEQLKKMMSNLIVERDAKIQAKKVDGDAIRELQEQHVHQIEDMDQEIQTLQDKLAASQEQHAKELNDEPRLSVVLQTVDKVMELTTENSRLSQEIQNLQEICIQDERRFQKTLAVLTERLQKNFQVHHKTDPCIKWDEDGILIFQTYLTQLAAIHEDSTKLLEQTCLSAGEQQPVDKIVELANENNRLSLGLQMLTERKNQHFLKAQEGFSLRKERAEVIRDNIRVIIDLETRLSGVEQQTIDKLKNKDLEIQTLQDKLAAGQEQHAKVLNDKDLVIQELKIRLSELETVDRVIGLRNEHNRLSSRLQMLQEESLAIEQKMTAGLQKKWSQKKRDKMPIIQTYATEMAAIHKESTELLEQTRLSSAEQQPVDEIAELTNQNNRLLVGLHMLSLRHRQCTIKAEEGLGLRKKEVLTEVHTELGKLYMELQEAKKPQEALMGQLADKDKEIECLMEQLEAKDSEVQNLKEMIQGGEVMNEKAVIPDGQSE